MWLFIWNVLLICEMKNASVKFWFLSNFWKCDKILFSKICFVWKTFFYYKKNRIEIALGRNMHWKIIKCHKMFCNSLLFFGSSPYFSIIFFDSFKQHRFNWFAPCWSLFMLLFLRLNCYRMLLIKNQSAMKYLQSFQRIIKWTIKISTFFNRRIRATTWCVVISKVSEF